MHIRRYFIDAVPKGKQYDYSQPAVQGVQYSNRLFTIEDSINKKYPGDYEKRKQLRLEKEKPVLEASWSWLNQQKPTRNTRMDKAAGYALNCRDTAETYLEDGRCSFTNNLSENALRPFAVGRKNWLFSSSVDGANASAVVYTMVEMAKTHDLNIYGYLKLLEQLNIEGCNILADRRYDSNEQIDYIYDHGGEPTIPSRKCNSFERHCDWWLYKERHLVEKYFQKLKAYRRIATKYDKLAYTYLGFICIASILIWLK